jgi:hypothetical protein
MRIAIIIVRVFVGGMFVFASLAFFFKWGDQPAPAGDVKRYMEGVSTVHLLQVVKTLELLWGLTILSGRFVALANAIIFPITCNIVLFHSWLDRPDLPIPALLLLGNLFLFYAYRKNYAGIFTARRLG